MKKYFNKLSAFLLAIAGTMTIAPSTFAANPYGINYTGGTPLGANNVQINPTLTDELTPLIKQNIDNTVDFSNSSKWQEAYYKYGNSSCRKSHYIKIWQNNQISSSDNLSYTISNDQYTIKVQLNNVYIENIPELSETGDFLAVFVRDANGGIDGGREVYEDANCENRLVGSKGISSFPDSIIYSQYNIKLYKKNTDTVFTTSELYFGILDIDGAQSYKILNQSNLLNSSNMYAKSAETLQPTDPSITLRNMYVADGNYIYSQYGDPIWGFDTAGSNIFTKINIATQQEGLNMVFGFASGAGSSIEFYAKQYPVHYTSDPNGEITGITDEDIISGNHPDGSTSEPKEDYEFEHWIADKDVELEDGTKIPAGQPLTPEQVKQVVVNEELTFTAIHTPIKQEPAPVAPNTGASTKDNNYATILSISMIGVLLGSLILGLLPKFFHKKVNFKK